MQAHGDRERHVLDLWERGVGLDRWQREDALLAAETPMPRRLGARNIALLRLRNAHFHGAWPMVSTCPACGGVAEFAVDCVSLAADLAEASAQEAVTFEWNGEQIVARPPTVDDLRAVARAGEPDAVARALLMRCVNGDIALAEADPHAIDVLGSHLEALDPAATVVFELTCPDCAHRWPALIDIAEALWKELRNRAEKILLEVDALASAYGWSEEQVLALSPVRRAAYLQLAGTS
jgi:hypothetical protein